MREHISDKSVTIATTNTLVSDSKHPPQQRAVLIIKNVSTAGEIINLAIGQEAKLLQGVQLNQGDTYQMSIEAGYHPSNERINAIASAGTAKLAVHEVIYSDG